MVKALFQGIKTLTTHYYPELYVFHMPLQLERWMNASPGAAKTFLKRNVGVILAVLQGTAVVHPCRKYETRVL